MLNGVHYTVGIILLLLRQLYSSTVHIMQVLR